MSISWNESAEFKCLQCKTVLPIEEMATDSEMHGWCEECDAHEKEACKRDEENDRDGYDDDYEDPAVTYERERGEAFQDRYDRWKREY